MEKVTKNLDLGFSTIVLALTVLLFMGANKLLEPIQGRTDDELAQEKFDGFFQSIGNFILESFGKSVVPIEKTYSLWGNLIIPLLLLIAVCAITIAILYYLIRSFNDLNDLLLNKVLKVILIILFLSILVFMAPRVWTLLLVNLKVLFAYVLIIGLIIGLLTSRNGNK